MVPLCSSACKRVKISNWVHAGVYVLKGTQSGRPYWLNHNTGYYLYNDGAYWNIDDDLDGYNDVIDFLKAVSSFPPSQAMWMVAKTTFPVIECDDYGATFGKLLCWLCVSFGCCVVCQGSPSGWPPHGGSV
jgi:hypothetical protein